MWKNFSVTNVMHIIVRTKIVKQNLNKVIWSISMRLVCKNNVMRR